MESILLKGRGERRLNSLNSTKRAGQPTNQPIQFNFMKLIECWLLCCWGWAVLPFFSSFSCNQSNILIELLCWIEKKEKKRQPARALPLINLSFLHFFNNWRNWKEKKRLLAPSASAPALIQQFNLFIQFNQSKEFWLLIEEEDWFASFTGIISKLCFERINFWLRAE